MSPELVAFLAQQADLEAVRRTAAMPTEADAVRQLWAAVQRLEELGWRRPGSAPEDVEVLVVEAFSSGRHKATLLERQERREDNWTHWDGSDEWGDQPLLWRALTETEFLDAATRTYALPALDGPPTKPAKPNAYLAAGNEERRGKPRAPAEAPGILGAALRGHPVGNWGPIKKPDPQGIHYHHCFWDTTRGRYAITWKGWKAIPSYDACDPSQEPIGTYGSLNEAKLAYWRHLDAAITQPGFEAREVMPAVGSTGAAVCTCPSGDGSLRYPCPVHPDDSATAAVERAEKAPSMPASVVAHPAPAPTSPRNDDGWQS